MPPPLIPGRIVWATIPDPNGVNPKRRAVVLLVGEKDLPTPSSPLLGVAVTSTFKKPLAEDQVSLSWNPQKAGTGLTKPCVAVCSWLVAIHRADIADNDISGVVPPRQMVEIQQKVKVHVTALPTELGSPPSATATGSDP